MSKSNAVIIGSGLFGTELDRMIRKKNSDSLIIKNVKSSDGNLIPNDTDTVIIVAQSPDYRKSVMTPDLLYVNTILPIQIMQQAVDAGVKKFVYCSTGSVYPPSTEPHVEDEMFMTKDISPYVATKQSAEILINSWKKCFDSMIILRPFFMYGSRQANDRLFSNMVTSIQNGKPIKLANKKGLVFNPIHVYDAAKFVLLVLETVKGYNIFNVAGSQKVSLADVVEIISKNLNKHPVIENTDEKESVFLGSVEKMKSIGFVQEVNLEDGIKEMIRGTLSILD
jgi:nucleoside-diphosphate-sugar epimerase